MYNDNNGITVLKLSLYAMCVTFCDGIFYQQERRKKCEIRKKTR